MIIGMRGHDLGRMEPAPLADAIAGYGFRATQLAFSKAFPQSPETYLTRDALLSIRDAFAARNVALPVMGCYVSASDRDPAKLQAAKEKFAQYLRASVVLGAGCVGTETTHFTFEESERENAYARLLDFTRHAAREAEACGAVVGIEAVAYHTLCSPQMTRRLLDEVNSPNLRVILDTANLLPPGETRKEAQLEWMQQALALYGDKICVLHVKDGTWNSENQWENRPLGEGCMDWATLLPILRAHNDSLCALREGVWPGRAREEYAIMCRWAQL